MDEVMSSATCVNLPPGFRFHPSDEEIVGYYLKNKVAGNKIKFDVIREIDLYKCEPWDLPEKSFLPSRDLEWYFFSPRDRKYPNGSRSNRATEAGYWKATGKDRKVNSQRNKIGMKKTLVFYKGRAPKGERTDWLMHEYRLDESQCKEGDKDQYVLCRVFKKGKQGSFNPENFDDENREMHLPLLKNTCSPQTVSEDDVEDVSERSSPPVPEDEPPVTSALPSETSSEVIETKNDDNNCIEGPVDSTGRRSETGCYMVPLLKEESETKNEPEQDNIAQFLNTSVVLEDHIDFPFAQAFENEYRELYPMTYQFNELDTANMDNLFLFEDSPNHIPCPSNEIVIECRPRSEQYHHAQQLPSQGNAPRRILLQMQNFKSPPDDDDTPISEISDLEELEGDTATEVSDLEVELKQKTCETKDLELTETSTCAQTVFSNVSLEESPVQSEMDKTQNKLDENNVNCISAIYTDALSEYGSAKSDTSHNVEPGSSIVSDVNCLASDIASLNDNVESESSIVSDLDCLASDVSSLNDIKKPCSADYSTSNGHKNYGSCEDKNDRKSTGLRMRKRSEENARVIGSARKLESCTEKVSHVCVNQVKRGCLGLLHWSDILSLLSGTGSFLTKHAASSIVLIPFFIILAILILLLTKQLLGRILFSVIS
eukprot:TRINITY_DN11004_c0_g1_i2.p1 TRINITY_DN11004_c0_g1~~TRINITY_DN11004_c0_g1_i2.p1  ORF type:complete len:657 (+),score=142.72 TRINITY_DN11004_c0_g1_i2:274-2244(+)